MTLPSFKERGTRLRLALLALVLVCCVALFTWAAYTFLPDAADTYQRQIVNDEYSVLTPPLAAGGEISQRMVVKGRIYGVILNLTTFDRVAQGTLHLRLYSQDGQVVAGSDADMSGLLDNTFHRFLFDVPVEGDSGTEFYLSLKTTPDTEADVLAFYRSEGPAPDFVEQGAEQSAYALSNFTLFENDTQVDGTLALQYVTRYAGNSIVRGFSLFAAALTLGLLLVFSLLFLFRAGLPAVFCVAAAALGLVMALMVPPAAGGKAAYVADAYHYSNVLLGAAGQDGPDQLLVRADDTGILEDKEMDAFLWQDITEGSAQMSTFSEPTVIPASRGGAAFVLYLPQILGLVLARLLGLNTFWLLLLPRFFALAVYILVAALALRRAPAVLQPLLAGVALLPSSLQLAGSFSPEGMALAAGLCLFAACAVYAKSGARMGVPQVCLLAVCAMLAALYHPAFAPLALAVLIIPAGRYPSKRFATVSAGLVMALAALCGVYAGLTTTVGSDAIPFNAQWLKTLLAGSWDGGAVLAGLNWLMPLALLALVFVLTVPHSQEEAPGPRLRLVAGIAGCLCVAVALAGLVWTDWPLAQSGQLLLPALPLLAVALGGLGLRFKRDAARPLLFSCVTVVVLLQLDAFIITIGG